MHRTGQPDRMEELAAARDTAEPARQVEPLATDQRGSEPGRRLAVVAARSHRHITEPVLVAGPIPQELDRQTFTHVPMLFVWLVESRVFDRPHTIVRPHAGRLSWKNRVAGKRTSSRLRHSPEPPPLGMSCNPDA